MRIFKFFITGALLLFLLGHVACTLIYVLPQHFTSPFIYNKAKTYMGPLFDQSWSLFAPAPEVNKSVFVSYSDKNGNWSDWNDPFSFYQNEAYAGRLSPCGRMVLAKSSTMHYLYEENKITFYKAKLFQGDTSSGYFSVLKYMVLHELSNRKIEFKKIKMMLVFTNVRTKKNYCLYYPEFEPEK